MSYTTYQYDPAKPRRKTSARGYGIGLLVYTISKLIINNLLFKRELLGY